MRDLIDKKLRVAKFTTKELIGKHKTRDDIDKLILGFNNILQTPELLNSILKKLDESLNLSSRLGREGMNYWRIFVFAVTRVTLNIDYDRLHNLTNNHIALRKIAGHGRCDDCNQYGFTTIKDNIRLLTTDVLDDINTLIVNHGQKITHPYSKKN
jgi:hypothetical protein